MILFFSLIRKVSLLSYKNNILILSLFQAAFLSSYKNITRLYEMVDSKYS